MILYDEQWDTLDANDLEDFEEVRSPKEIELLWRSTKKLYKAAMTK